MSAKRDDDRTPRQRRNDRVATGVAALFVALFVVGQTIAWLDPSRPVPKELYPLVGLAATYLLGIRIVSNGKSEK